MALLSHLLAAVAKTSLVNLSYFVRVFSYLYIFVQALTTNEQKNMVLNIAFDHLNLEDEGQGFCDYLKHIGFDITAITDTKELPAAILGHYRIKQGEYDVDRAAMDLATCN